jgi:hypothetical protein
MHGLVRLGDLMGDDHLRLRVRNRVNGFLFAIEVLEGLLQGCTHRRVPSNRLGN